MKTQYQKKKNNHVTEFKRHYKWSTPHKAMLIFELLDQYEGICRRDFFGCAAKLNKTFKANIIEILMQKIRLVIHYLPGGGHRLYYSTDTTVRGKDIYDILPDTVPDWVLFSWRTSVLRTPRLSGTRWKGSRFYLQFLACRLQHHQIS